MSEEILSKSETLNECEDLKNKIYELNNSGNLIAGKILNAVEVMAMNGYNSADAKEELLDETIPQAVSEIKEELGEGFNTEDQVQAVKQVIDEILKA